MVGREKKNVEKHDFNKRHQAASNTGVMRKQTTILENEQNALKKKTVPNLLQFDVDG